MFRALKVSRLALVLLTSTAAHPACIPYHEAGKFVGETKCVSGKVLRIKEGRTGVTFFDFCEDYRTCPFTVVVFPRDLKNVGDVRTLEGKQVEIHGDIKIYDGRAEIILRRAAQFSGPNGSIPPLPKGYDVEKKGRYSAGTLNHPSSRKPAKKRQPIGTQTEQQVDPMSEEQ